MGLPQEIALPTQDRVNERIWCYLHDGDQTPLDTLPTDRLGMDIIRAEIASGCSPCPDILTNGFGTRPSVLLVATVYGLIYDRLKQEFSRSGTSWHDYIDTFYRQIIFRGKGIYSRLDRLYDLACRVYGSELEFCFTELVKTVLADPDGSVSGLEGFWLRYFVRHEQGFLRQRLAGISGTCIVFTFSETATLATLAILGGEQDLFNIRGLPSRIKALLRTDQANHLRLQSWMTQRGNPRLSLTVDRPKATYTQAIAGRTFFRLKGSALFVVPLPHPSQANNQYWPERAWPELERLLLRIPLGETN